MGKNNSKFGLALVVGAAAGYAASLFMSDKARKAHKQAVTSKVDELASKLLSEKDKEKAKDLFESTVENADKQLVKIKTELAKNITAAHKTLGEVDKKKYSKAVEKTIDSLKKKGKLNTKELKKVKDYLEADYSNFKVIKDESEKV